MPWAAAAAIGGALITSNAQSSSASKAAKAQTRSSSEATAAQTRASELAIAEQQRQFDETKKLLAPYVVAGQDAMTQQQTLLGLSGQPAQEQAIGAFEQSPQFQALARQGEQGILQGASATGGLRGGNVQAALAQFRPALLNQQIQQQLQNLGGLSSMGQAAAAGQAGFGQQAGANIGNLYGQIGSAQAGGSLARGQAQAGNALAQGQAQGQLYGSLSNIAGYGIYNYMNPSQSQMLAQQNEGF